MRDTAHTAEMGPSERFRRSYLTRRQPKDLLVSADGAGNTTAARAARPHGLATTGKRYAAIGKRCLRNVSQRSTATASLAMARSRRTKARSDPGLGFAGPVTAGCGIPAQPDSARPSGPTVKVVAAHSGGVPIRSRLPSGSRSSISRPQGTSLTCTPNSEAMASTSRTRR